MKKILVVAAHPDDEILGVGATIMKHISDGDEARCIILGEGQTSRMNILEKEKSKEVVSRLHKNTLEAAKIIGYSKVDFADFGDNRFDSVDLLDIVKYIECVIKEYQPNIIYTHYEGDLNIDHQIVHKAVLVAARPVNEYSVEEIYTFDTLSSSEWNFSYLSKFNPNVFVDIEDYLDTKIKAMECYETELCIFPHPRSIEGIITQSKYYGMIVGKNNVEAFRTVRVVR